MSRTKLNFLLGESSPAMDQELPSKNELKHIRMPDEVIQAIGKLAKSERRTFTDQVIILLEAALGKRTGDPPEWAQKILGVIEKGEGKPTNRAKKKRAPSKQ